MPGVNYVGARLPNCRRALAFFRDYDANELEQLWKGEWLPERWLCLWSARLEPAPGGEDAKALTPSRDLKPCLVAQDAQ